MSSLVASYRTKSRSKKCCSRSPQLMRLRLISDFCSTGTPSENTARGGTLLPGRSGGYDMHNCRCVRLCPGMRAPDLHGNPIEMPTMMPSAASASSVSRRTFLRAGASASLGLSLPSLFLRAESALAGQAAEEPNRRPSIRSCILIYFYGGPSHIDTWDMKVSAPREVRGEFAPIHTSVSGIQVCEHLPRMARLAHKWSVVRSMHHPMTNHNAAAVEAMCGRTPLRGDLELLDD